jgi:alpha-L-fucosidase
MLKRMINRRKFIKTGVPLLAGAAICPRLALGADGAAGAKLPLPTAAQAVWQDCEIGLLYSFDLAIAAGDRSPNNNARRTWDPNLYQPARLDTDQWIEAAKSCGARYAVFTATHFNGFMQWQSDAYPYGLKQTSWRGGKGDVVADFAASCRRAGIKPGIFFSVHRNAFHQVWGHYVDWGKGRGTPAQEVFNRIAEQQMREICSKYGPLGQIWFDAGTKTPAEGGPDLLPIFAKHQPDGIFYHSSQRSDHRWVGNEDGHAGSPCYATMPGPEQGALSHNSPNWKRCLHGGDPSGSAWSPAMVDIPLRGYRGHNWFYKEDQDQIVYPPDVLLSRYYTSVGRNANLLIGAVIKPDGSLPEGDVKALDGLGKLLRERFAKPVAAVADREGGEILLDLPRPQEIDHVIVQEQIEHGERVRDHVVEGLAGETWVPLAQGKVIGHKWIHRFKARTISRVRLRVAASLATPKFRSMACYQVGEDPAAATPQQKGGGA